MVEKNKLNRILLIGIIIFCFSLLLKNINLISENTSCFFSGAGSSLILVGIIKQYNENK